MQQQSTLTIVFAYIAAAYIGACVLYLIGSPLAGRPWASYLRTLPREALYVRSASAGRRTVVFGVSALLMTVVLWMWKPFGAVCGEDGAPRLSSLMTRSKLPIAVIRTSRGDIEVELYSDLAPRHVENFLKHCKSGYYKGTIFHRIIKDFMIQGGDPNGDGTGGATADGQPLALEVSSDLKHLRGVLSMARSADPDSAGSQFFICHKDSPFLDGNYSAFGMVIKGLDVVDSIANAKTDSKDRPEDPITIFDVSVKGSA